MLYRVIAIVPAAALIIAGCTGSVSPDGGDDRADAAPDDETDPGPDAGDGDDDVRVYHDYLYAVTGQGLRSFSIDSTSMMLTDADGPNTAPSLATAVDPTGRFVFAAELQQSNNTYKLATYAINATTGRLSRVDSTMPTHLFPFVMTVNPAGTHLFVGDESTDQVASYAIDATGRLQLVDAVTVGVSGSSYNDLQIDAAGRHLYVGAYAGGDRLQTVLVAPDGDLTLGPAISDAASLTGLHLTPNGQYLYTGHGFGGTKIDSYRIDGNGTPVYLRSLEVGETTRLIADPTGTFLYAGRSDGRVMIYRIAADGSLSAVSQTPVTDLSGQPGRVFSLSFHPGGGALYVHVRGAPTDSIQAFVAAPQTGALTSLGPATSLAAAAFQARSLRMIE